MIFHEVLFLIPKHNYRTDIASLLTDPTLILSATHPIPGYTGLSELLENILERIKWMIPKICISIYFTYMSILLATSSKVKVALPVNASCQF